MKYRTVTFFACGFTAAMMLAHPHVCAQLQLQESPSSPRETNVSADKLVKIQVSADVERIQPGEKFHLAIAFSIEPGWHIYWRNSGAAGGPTEIQVTAPPGFEVGETLFPRPKSFAEEVGITYGYEDEVVIFVEVTPSHDVAIPQASFQTKIDWLVCKNVCLMGKTQKMLSLGVGGSSVPGSLGSKPHPRIEVFKNRIPTSIEDVDNSFVDFDNDHLTVALPADGESTGEFFPGESPGVSYGNAEIVVEDYVLHVRVPVKVNPQNALGKPLAIRGVVALGRGPDDPCFEIEFSLSQALRP